VDKPSLTLGALGSGSDYSPFIQHLGIPSLNLGFGGEGSGGEYHSIYDSYDHYARFKDPTFEYGITLAKVAGRAALRMANADVLPFDFRSFYNTVSGYVDNVSRLLEDMREATRLENQMIREKRFTYAADPTKTFVAPDAKEEVPYLNFSGLNNAMADLETATKLFAELRTGNTKPNTNIMILNKTLFQAEQKLTVQQGLPLRPWFRHTIYAPGLYTGYGVKTLPGIREAIEERRWTEAQEQIEIVTKAIVEYTTEVSAASKLLMMR
jgi:N-acetylated-alpha-linked acidic dipeptidase